MTGTDKLFSHRTEPNADVANALRLFHETEEVRDAFKLMLAENTPYREHRLHSALHAAGIPSRLDRARIVSLMRNSSHFKEALTTEDA